MGAIKVIITGALGKMGRQTAITVENDFDLNLVGLVDVKASQEMKSDITGNNDNNFRVCHQLEEVLDKHPDVMVDFTNPHAVFQNARLALENKINCVIGTTGLTEYELKELEAIASKNDLAVAVIPNFAIGAVLMMKMASEAARYFSQVEIIELHHHQKMDAPSGTAIKTAEMIAKHRKNPILTCPVQEYEKISGARGACLDDIHIHSVRLPGLVAHQEVILGDAGQTLTIRHDSYDRSSFMPGVLLVIKKIVNLRGLIYGLENFL